MTPAAGALAWAGISMPPAVAAVLMSGSTVVVAANAQLLRRVRLVPDPAREAPAESGRTSSGTPVTAS